LQMQCH